MGLHAEEADPCLGMKNSDLVFLVREVLRQDIRLAGSQETLTYNVVKVRHLGSAPIITRRYLPS